MDRLMWPSWWETTSKVARTVGFEPTVHPMLSVIIYPFADMRRFLDDADICLRPTWPIPLSNEFVRSFGGVQDRLRGGAAGWAGDSRVCDASGVLSFDRSPRLLMDSGREAPARCAFRRLFADGSALAKVEIGLAVGEPLHGEDLRVASMLETQVIVRTHPELTVTTLGRCGDELATMYARASSRSRAPSRFVRVGRPCVVVETADHVSPRAAIESRKLTRSGLSVTYQWVAGGAQPIPAWRIGYRADARRRLGRDLRVCLTRLYAEREVAAMVLSLIAQKALMPKPRGEASQRLQRYLLDTLRVIRMLSSQQEELSGARGLGELSYSTMFAGDLDALVNTLETALENFDCRKNITHDVIKAVSRGALVNLGDIIMGNQISIGGDAIVNIDSSLENVRQMIAKSSLDDDSQSVLSDLIASLRRELANAHEADRAKVQLLVRRVEEVAAEAAKPPAQRDSSLMQITAKGMLDAAAALAGVLPTAFKIVTSIAQFASGLVG